MCIPERLIEHLIPTPHEPSFEAPENPWGRSIEPREHGVPFTKGQLEWIARNSAHGVMEADPTGRDPHTPGAKLDAAKNRLGLVLRGFARALVLVGEVGTYGARKYTPNGWKEVPDGEERYMDAAFRHLFDEVLDPTDPDTGLQHLAQTVWNLLAVLEFRIRNETHKRVTR